MSKEQTKHLICYTDGGARGNPGPSGIGVVLMNEAADVKEAEISEYLGHGTNNQAEYTALLRCLEKAKELQAGTVHVRLDSELVVKQMSGEYKVKNAELQKLFLKIWNLRQEFKKVTFEHVRREFNKEADRLANEAMDRGN